MSLKNLINKNEKTKLTLDQVEHWVGSDTTADVIDSWLEEGNPVESSEVLSLWESTCLVDPKHLQEFMPEIINPTIVKVESLDHYETFVSEKHSLTCDSNSMTFNDTVIQFSSISKSLSFNSANTLIAFSTDTGESYLVES